GFAFVHPDDLQQATREYVKLFKRTAETVRFETRLRHRDGAYLWAEVVGSRLEFEPGVTAIVNNFRDITERKRADEALQLYTERLKTQHSIDQAILKMQPLEQIAELVLDFIH